MPWSAAPEFKGDAARVNPEEAFVASLSTCHMLTFLGTLREKALHRRHLRSTKLSGVTGTKRDGKILGQPCHTPPKVAFSGDRQPSTGEISELHHAAHENCFVANSVKSEVTVDWQ